jgi:DNA-binding NarL/FixJ family response regulator
VVGGGAVSVRVMVVDDHPMWREGVARDLAERGLEVVATAGDGAAAVRIAPAVRPDVVLMDLQMPHLDGVGATAAILEALPGTRVLVLSASAEQGDVLGAVRAGAAGYLVKSAQVAELVDAVERTAAGQAVFGPELAGLVLGEFRRRERAARDAPGGGEPAITPRETEVLRLVATGMNNKEIASTLVLSEHTVHRHVANILRKLAPRDAPGTGGPAITTRETEVLRLVAKGLTARRIAERLGLSPRTVENHVQNVLRKLALTNRVELARYAIEQGIDSDS